MIALILALLMAAPAAALDEDAPGRPALKARDAIDALPAEAKVELRNMFLKYRDELSRRQEQGWESGVLSDAVIEDVDEPFQPARLLEDALRKRRSELADLQAALDKTSRDSTDYGKLLHKIEDKKDAISRARRRQGREKGICRDWSDDVWFLFQGMNLDDWTADDRRRTARPFHTAAVACAPPDDPAVCLAFDPWETGKPDVFAFGAWDAHEPGGRLPPDYFLHGLPEKVPDQ